MKVQQKHLMNQTKNPSNALLAGTPIIQSQVQSDSITLD